ncbi:hypothetical protein CL622_02925 [archaeon]|nr:hypothetical protein [archaeon]|tara:strand:- start:4051 stop:4341 length:291 start_codon:yes stop_codon:yes gene_type:complete
MGQCEEQSCCSEKGDCKEGEMTGCEMTDMMFGLAEKAWSDAVKAKMQKLFEEQMGEKLDTIAKAGVDGAMSYWEHKMSGKGKCEEFKQNVKKAFVE